MTSTATFSTRFTAAVRCRRYHVLSFLSIFAWRTAATTSESSSIEFAPDPRAERLAARRLQVAEQQFVHVPTREFE